MAVVKNFAVSKNVREVRRFLGMTSYYHKFIPRFAKVAEALHHLTRKDVEFLWTPVCQQAFDALKERITTAHFLSYHSFDQYRYFILETDASIQAVLSQEQSDGKIHPVAFASKALSPSQKNYSIMELETLTVVWAINHFHSHLYGHHVTVYTDHSTVKAVLETPNPSRKHARWWT